MKYRKDKYPEAVSQNYWRKQSSWKNEEEPFYTNQTSVLRKILIEGRKGTPKQGLLFQINLNYM